MTEDRQAELDELLGKGAVGPKVKIQRRYGEDIECASSIDWKIVISTWFERFGLTENIAALESATTSDLLTALTKLKRLRSRRRSFVNTSRSTAMLLLS